MIVVVVVVEIVMIVAVLETVEVPVSTSVRFCLGLV